MSRPNVIPPERGAEEKEGGIEMTIRTLIRNHPAQVAASALRDAERAMNRAQVFAANNWGQRGAFGFVPRLQADESETDYVISAELPGVDGGDVEVTIEDGVLTLAGVRKAPTWSEELSDEEKEQHSVSFKRRVRFNGEVDEPNVQARYANGLLTVTVPKPKPITPEVKSIPIEVA